MAADGLKQRLVGGAALLVIGVVAWFWLLSADSPVDPVARETQIPPAPDLQPFTVAEPQAPKDVIPASEPGASEVETTAEPVAATPAAPIQQKPAIASLPTTPSKVIAPKTVEAKNVEPKNVEPKNVEPKNISPKNIEPKPALVKTPTQAFQLDQQGLPVAWVIQVGLFSTQANADRIKNELQQKGFKAYTQAVKTAKGAGVKVFVGPKLSRERADAQKKAIDAALQTNTMVVRFTPS